MTNFDKHTGIPYRASTGSEQGFPCVVFPHRENPVFIAGFPVDENRFFPVGNTTQGKPCFHYRLGFAVYIHSKQSGNNMDEKMGTTGQQNTKEIHTHCTVCPKSKEERN